MVRHPWVKIAVTAVAATLAVAGCSSSKNSSNSTSSSPGSAAAKTTDASKAQSAADLGGMDALVAAAKKEGTLNIIAVPRTWAGYGAIIDGFTAKYGIKINSENPDGSSGDEINAVKSTKGQASAPDVVDVGNSYALSGAQEGDFAPYKVTTWSDIPDAQKDAGGLWYSDYGGYISIGCNAAKVGGTCPKTIKELDNPAYKGDVALNGDPTSANAAFEAVWAAALANGGSATNIQPGIDFFHTLNSKGIFNKTKVTPATVASGETPIVLDWDYLNVGNAATLKTHGITWTTNDPSDGLVSGYYAQAVSINAAHPAAARLWEEYLYGADGQNGWLKGFARPIELSAMQKANTADPTALAAVPPVTDSSPFTPTQDQVTAAKAVVTQKWAAAVS
ncbi:MAG TPA: ABC transporter substrate-binding protein [Jatrophihabitans sp.]|jgi:putative spermidine/putrescine transport system substrate-binding protein